MAEQSPECVVCGEPLTIPATGDHCGCRRCGAIHVIDRSATAAVRIQGPREAKIVLDRARQDVQAIAGNIDFLRSEVPLTRRHALLSIGGVALLFIAGVGLLIAGWRPKEDSGPGGFTDETPSSLPGMSWQEQSRVVLRGSGFLLLAIGALVLFLLPWRRWHGLRDALKNALLDREAAEALIRRIAQRNPDIPK